MAKKIKTGRKKIDPAEKVILVGFYTKQSNVTRVGGMERAREIAKDSVENPY